jgi:hypothetical protein
LPKEKLYNIKRHPKTCISFENGRKAMTMNGGTFMASGRTRVMIILVGSTIIDAVLQGSF